MDKIVYDGTVRVLFVTSEVAGLFKLGGLADVSQALPLALAHVGVNVGVALPYYSSMNVPNVTGVGEVVVEFGGEKERVFVFASPLNSNLARATRAEGSRQTAVPNGCDRRLSLSPVGSHGGRRRDKSEQWSGEGRVLARQPFVAGPAQRTPTVFLFRHPRLNDYHGKHITEVFAFYCACVCEFYRQSARLLGYQFDIIHCNDWHTGLVPLILGETRKVGRRKPDSPRSNELKTIMTVHNLMYQGDTVATRIIDNLSLSKEELHIVHGKEGDMVSFLREGLEYADSISTVSPTYAKEVLTAQFGRSLVDVFRRRSDTIVGILNGIDTDVWNPATDPCIAVNYTRTGSAGAASVHDVKPLLKRELRQKVGLADSEAPLFAFIGRIEPKQKGIDILMDAFAILGQQAALQCIVLGTGEPRAVRALEALAMENQRRIAFVNAFDETLAHQIYAGADCLIVPSKFEPCGLIQLIAMRYGTLPLVRKTGGLADTVADGKTGFVFSEYSARALADKIIEVIVTCRDKKVKWNKMVDRAMRQDFSWKKSALKYKQLYKTLMRK